MSNFDFGQLVLGDKAPSLLRREIMLRNGIEQWHYAGGYIRVLAVRAVTASTFYAAVSFASAGEKFVSYVAGSIKCHRKGDGYWCGVECFLATKSVPHTLTGCPDDIFDAGSSTGLNHDVDPDWLKSCEMSKKVRANKLAIKRGAVFKLDQGMPSKNIAGQPTSYAVIINKRIARYIDPVRGATLESDTDLIAENYSQVHESEILNVIGIHTYTEVGELLFDLSGRLPQLKGRLVAGAKARMILVAREIQKIAHTNAIIRYDFASKFQTGSWLT